MANLREIFSFRNISAAIEAVKTGIPDRLPAAFNTITENVIGNETTYHKFYGMRKLVKRVEYGAPARHYGQNPIVQQPLILTSFKAFAIVEQELMIHLREVDSLLYAAKAREFIERKARELKTRFENNRIAHKVQMLRKGAFWYDNDGVLLQSSSGAVATVDFAIPAAQQGQAGGLVTATWATSSTPIYSNLLNIQTAAVQKTGRPLKHAFYGKSLPGWIFANDSFKYYFNYNPTYYQAFTNKPGVIPDGFMGMEWHPMSDVFWENEAGSIVQGWDDDVLVLTPEITNDVYTFFQGSEIVPTSMGVQQGDNINLENSQLVYGMHGYSVQNVDPLQIKLILGDNSMPVWKNNLDMWILDVAP